MKLMINEKFDKNKLYRTLDIDISELAGLSKSEIIEILDDAQEKTQIHGVYSKYYLDNYYDEKEQSKPIESTIKKETYYKPNYFNPVRITNHKVTKWTVDGSEENWIVSLLYDVLHNKSKYYTLLSDYEECCKGEPGRVRVTKDELDRIYDFCWNKNYNGDVGFTFDGTDYSWEKDMWISNIFLDLDNNKLTISEAIDYYGLDNIKKFCQEALNYLNK